MLSWQRIKCRLGFHRLFRKQRLTRQSDLIGCACCGREWGLNHDVQGVLPWGGELERFYADIGVTVNHSVQPPGIAPRGYAENLP